MAAAKYTFTGVAPGLHYENAAAMLDPEGYWWSFMRRLSRGYIQTKTLEEGGWKEIKAATYRNEA